MNFPSQKATELLRRLHDSRSFWDKVTGRKEPPLRVFDEIASSGEWSTIPELANYLLSSANDIRNQVSRTIAHLIGGMNPADFVELDELCRTEWAYPSSTTRRLRELKPTDLEAFRSLRNAAEATGVASFHGNGFVRHAAVIELAKMNSGVELPFLLVRMNDWVPVVREEAASAVLLRVQSDYAAHLFRNLRLILRLKSCGRSQHAPVVGAVIELLQKPECSPILLEGMKSTDRWLRRNSFQIAIASKTFQETRLLNDVLSDADPIIRLWTIRNAVARLENTRLFPLLSMLVKDPFMSVRCEALNLYVQRLGSAAFDTLQNALFDRHASIRALARFWIQKWDTNHDFAMTYRQLLKTPDNQRTRGAILGLGETGTSTDADVLLPFLCSQQVGNRRATIQSLASLDGDRHAHLFFSLLQDDHPGISNEAAKALTTRCIPLFEQLEVLFASERRPHVRNNVFKLLARQTFWTRGSFYIEALGNPDIQIANRARRDFSNWMTHSCSMAAGPSVNELQKLETAIGKSTPHLTSWEIRQLRFHLDALKSSNRSNEPQHP